ncbi:Hydroxypyruvate reductase [subsurface metagenome]
MLKAKVLFVGALSAQYAEWLTKSAPPGFSVVILPASAGHEKLLKEVEDADFLILRHSDFPDEFYQAGKQLKLIHITGMGYDWLPLPLLQELDIPLANIGGENAIAVAEHAVTLMLMVLRRVVPAMAALRDGKWRKDLDDSLSAELHQKTVGIVGVGNIGRWAGRIVSGFGAKVIFCDAIKMSLTAAALIPGRQVTLDELLRTADVVSLHVPLSKDTQGLIGSGELDLMKPSAIIINTCRGPVIDEAALIDALRQQRIAGAGLDVFEQEPIDLSNPLLQMEQVLCTPHMGGAAKENFPRRTSQIWENFEAVLRGELPVNLVNTKVA